MHRILCWFGFHRYAILTRELAIIIDMPYAAGIEFCIDCGKEYD